MQRKGLTHQYIHEVWPVAVKDGAEGQPVAKGRGHVRDLHVPVALRHVLAPLLQALHSRLSRHRGAPLATAVGLEREREMRNKYAYTQ